MRSPARLRRTAWTRLRGFALSVAVALAVLLPLLGAGAAPAAADVDDFEFASFDAAYTLSRADDGTSVLDVVETLVAVFPDYDQNRGIRRQIPADYLGAPLSPELVSVTDERGVARPAEVDEDGGWFTITSRADDYLHGAQTYVIHYRLVNVVGAFADTGVDEFYWDVNGDGWAQPFGSVSMTLTVAPELRDAMTGDAACYRGGYGATERCDIVVADGTATADAGALGPYETMTVAVAFTAGTFTPFDDGYLSSPFGWAQAAGGVGVLAALGAAGAARATRLRDRPGRPTVIAEYEPPDGVDALTAAVLLGRTTKAIPAEVLEQAVVGSIRIVEGPQRWFRPRLVAELVDPAHADADGRALLAALFPGGKPGDTYEFGSTDTRFSSRAQSILQTTVGALKRQGYYERVGGWTRAIPLLIAAVSLAAIILFGTLALDAGVTEAPVIIGIVLGSVALTATIILVARRPLSSRGAETRDHLKGLREFIAWAEADRIRMLQSPTGAERAPVDVNDPRQMLRIYERLLPYAVVFGLEQHWANVLAVHYGDNSPTWYAGTGAFNAAAFASGIGTLNAVSASASSSGGSSGGGSAGGGGGGGGGGGV